MKRSRVLQFNNSTSSFGIGKLLIVVASFCAAFAFAFIDPDFSLGAGSTLTGKVTHVRDGDTIEVEGVPIRLNGLSAPERGDPFGSKATAFMRNLVDGKPVRCELTGATTYDRQVGTCYLNGVDISATIIRAGLALDCPRYSRGRYAADEAAARATGIKQAYTLPGYCR